MALMRRAHRLRSEIDSSLLRSAEVAVDLRKKTCTDEAVGSLLEKRMQQTRYDIRLYIFQGSCYIFSNL